MRIRHYIGSIVAGCSLGGLVLAFELAVLFRSIEDRSQEVAGLSRSLSDVVELHRTIEAWVAGTRDSLGVKSAREQVLGGQDLLVRLGELREAPGGERHSSDLDTAKRRLQDGLGILEVGSKYSSDNEAHAGRLAEARESFDVFARRLVEAIGRVETGLGREEQVLLLEIENRRNQLWSTVASSALSYVALVLLLWRWTLRRLIRPLQTLTEESRRSSGGENFRLVPTGPLEVRLLTESLSGLVGSLIDSRAHLEEKVRERTGDLERANRAKDEFLANMSHEIRTPMTAILGYAELLLAPDTSDSDRQRYAEIIFANGEHLLSVINDILDVSKIQAGRMTVAPTPCSPFEVASQIRSLMEIPAREKGLSLSVVNEGPVPEVVRTDPTRLRQILLNLVNNAIKFTEQGTVELAFRMEARDGDEAREELVFEVRDSGVGMSSEEIERVFRPFVQADTSTTRKYGGTGLGLAISRALARLLGGDLVCRSELGKGSVFVVTIEPGPLEGVRRRSSFPAVRRSPEVFPASAAPGPPLSGRVLLAEDVEVNRRLLSRILERSGLRVEEAENGRIAVEKALAAEAAGEPYDIVFMDMQMPEMDGYEASSRLRDQGYRSPIVALTSHSLPEERERCLGAGCAEFMTKPVDRLELLKVLSRFLPGPADGQERLAS